MSAAVAQADADVRANGKAEIKAGKPSKDEGRSPKHALAGSLAGMMSKTILQPMDLIKTRMQVQEASVAYRSLGHAFTSIYAEGGIRAFYTGYAPNLMGSGVSWGVYFYAFNFMKSVFRGMHGNTHRPLHAHEHFLSAATAGVVTSLVTNPIWVVKTRLQVQSSAGGKMYTGIFDCVSRIVREEGPLAFYRGLGPALSLVSNGAIQFMTYEQLRKLLKGPLQLKEEDLKLPHFLAMGALAKTISSTATYPLQVVRSRLYERAVEVPVATDASSDTKTKVSADTSKTLRHGAKYKSASEVVRVVWAQQGWRGFYRGLLPQLLKTAPGSALTFTCYELILRALGDAERAAETFSD